MRPDQPAPPPAPAAGTLIELALLFLKLGVVGFGGPAAHVALMEDEVVHRRGWLSREAFLEYLGATNLIPGPNSTELAIHIGQARAGWRGLLVAGSCFILPSMTIVGVLAWVYVRFGTVPAAAGVLVGVKPVVIVVVLQALRRLAGTALRSPWLVLVFCGATAATFAGVHELVTLGVAASVAAALRPRDGAVPRTGPGGGTVGKAAALSAAGLGGGGPIAVSVLAAATPPTATSLFLIFVKIGSVLFGSGYVLLAFLRADLVERLGWLTERQLLDAVAIGQVTPGPVFTTATFVGYVLAGTPGAVAATVGIFLPAFLFVAISGFLLPRLRRSPRARAALDGVNAASLALMTFVVWKLAGAAVVDPVTLVVAVAAGLLVVRTRLNPAWLILGGAVVGLVAESLRRVR